MSFGKVILCKKKLPVRKNIRVQGHDYSSKECYFITICIKDRYEILGTIDVGTNCVRPVLSDEGALVENEINILSDVYDNVFIDKYIVMPNHIHMIIVITNDGRTQFVPTISRIIKQFKGSVTKKLGFSLWQSRFRDHIVRDEADYQRICKYIDENPRRWTEDKYYTIIGNIPNSESCP